MSIVNLPYHPSLARAFAQNRISRLTASVIAAESVLKDAHNAYLAAHDAYSEVAHQLDLAIKETA